MEKQKTFTVSVNEMGTCRKELAIEVSADHIQKEYDQYVSAFQKQAKLPGFRPGKAPVQMVKNRFHKDIMQELHDAVMPRTYHEAVQQEGLDVVQVLDLKEEPVELGKPYTFTVTVDVQPDFQLPDYDGIEVEGKAVSVEDSAVDDTLNSMRQRMAEFHEVEGRPVKTGDVVKVDYTAECDGKPLSEIAENAEGLEKAEGAWISADDDAFLPGMGAALTGMNIEEQKDIEVSFPEDFQPEQLRGRTVLYHVTVKDLRERILPEMNEEFLKRFGVDSEEELRKRILSNLHEVEEQKEQNRRRDEVSKQLLSRVDFDLPDSEVQQETKSLIQDIVKSNVQRGVPQNQLEENRDEIFENASKGAADKVRMRYLLHAIAEKENISVNVQEVNASIQRMASGYGMDPETFRKELVKRNAFDNVKEDIRLQKALDLVVEKAKIQESA